MTDSDDKSSIGPVSPEQVARALASIDEKFQKHQARVNAILGKRPEVK